VVQRRNRNGAKVDGRHMIIIGIDPGWEESAIVAYDSSLKKVTHHETSRNDVILKSLQTPRAANIVVIEQIEGFGMAVGREVFETVWWSGRFFEAWCENTSVAVRRAERLTRKAVKIHLCGQIRARDSEVRQAIIDKFGMSKALAIGTSKAPGPLFGVKGHEFAALAVAITWAETKIGPG
jgi:hypothetical protein